MTNAGSFLSRKFSVRQVVASSAGRDGSRQSTGSAESRRATGAEPRASCLRLCRFVGRAPSPALGPPARHKGPGRARQQAESIPNRRPLFGALPRNWNTPAATTPAGRRKQ
jgi:hypothetical protein